MILKKEGTKMESPKEEFDRLTALPLIEQARPAIKRRIQKLANMPENTAQPNAKHAQRVTKKAPAKKTSRYNAEYAKAYREARRREAEDYPIKITLDF